jgi:hypothetical protein
MKRDVVKCMLSEPKEEARSKKEKEISRRVDFSSGVCGGGGGGGRG